MKKTIINIGDIYGELLIVKIYDNKYECLCSCGNHCSKNHSQLVKNSMHPDCGCQNKNIIGRKFGQLLVISFDKEIGDHLRNTKRKMYNCLCDCGQNCSISQKLLTGSGRGYKHCGCKTNHISKFIYYKNIISGYTSKTKLRKGLNFELKEFEYASLFNSPCYYCNSEPSNLYRHKGGPVVLKYTGIDRIDSDKGYIIENVVPCCAKCNFMKNSLSHDEFMSHIVSIQQNCILPYKFS